MSDPKNKDIYGFSEDHDERDDRANGTSGAAEDETSARASEDDRANRAEGDSDRDSTKSSPKSQPDADVWEPILMEGEGVTECPNCGAPMPGDDEVVCIRCGFNLTRMSAVNVETGEIIVDESGKPVTGEEVEEEPKPPLCIAGKGGLIAPAIIAGACVLFVTIFYFAGWHGVYKTDADGLFWNAESERYSLTSPTFLSRIGAVVRYWAFTMIVAASVVGGLSFIGFIEKRKVGEMNLALLRSLAIVAASSLAILIGFPDTIGWAIVETSLQLIAMACVFVLLAWFFFEFTLREAGVLSGVALGFFLLIALMLDVASGIVS